MKTQIVIIKKDYTHYLAWKKARECKCTVNNLKDAMGSWQHPYAVIHLRILDK